METMTAEVWKLGSVVERFLGMRAALPLAQEQIGVMLAILGTRKKPVARFLDLGCGDGILGAAILGKFPTSHGVLADFSGPMLAQACKQLSDFSGQLTFLDLDYSSPAWVQAVKNQGPYDAIVSGYSIHHQPDARKRQLYAEIFGLLAQGGWFVNIEHIASAAALSTELFETHIIDGRFAMEVRSGGPKTRAQIADIFNQRPDRAANLLAPVETQCDWLRTIGYEDVDCYFRIYDLAVFAGQHPQ
jgi:tRNA (cmo5U34)-methyltransferase